MSDGLNLTSSAPATTTTIPTRPTSPEIISQACVTCHILKPLTEYNEKDGCYYPNCQQCFFTQSAAFWQGKNYKYCVGCAIYVPLRKYDYSNGSPYPKCRRCYETATIARKMRERAEREGAMDVGYARPVATHNNPQVQGKQNAGRGRAAVVSTKSSLYGRMAPLPQQTPSKGAGKATQRQ